MQGVFGNGGIDFAGALHLGKIAHTAQQRVGDTRGATATQGNFARGILFDGHAEQVRRTLHNVLQHLVAVVFQVAIDAKAGTQRRGEQSASCGGTDEGEGRQIKLHGACAGSFVNHNIDAVVFHRRIEVFLHHGAEAVNFVDKQHIVFVERGEQTRQIAGFVEHGTRRNLEAHAELVGDDIAQGGFTQARRAVKEDVVECLATHARSSHKHLQIFQYFVLTGEVAEAHGA